MEIPLKERLKDQLAPVTPRDLAYLLTRALYGLLFKALEEWQDLWSRLVYTCTSAYKRLRAPQVIEALRALWVGRFVAYAKEAEGLDVQGTEAFREEQSKVFEKNREYLLNTF